METYLYLLAGMGVAVALISIAVAVLFIVGTCKVFTKMGRQWWEGIIPFYNLFVLAEKTFGNGWWFLCFFIVCVPVIGGILAFLFNIVWCIRLARSFNQGTGFTVGLVLLYPIFILILGFGDAQYTPLAPFDIAHPFDVAPAGYYNTYANNGFNNYTNSEFNNNMNNNYGASENFNNGNATAPKVFCTNCGAELQPGQNFCTNCGTKRA
jgi:hypothetical protein